MRGLNYPSLAAMAFAYFVLAALLVPLVSDVILVHADPLEQGIPVEMRFSQAYERFLAGSSRSLIGLSWGFLLLLLMNVATSIVRTYSVYKNSKSDQNKKVSNLDFLRPVFGLTLRLARLGCCVTYCRDIYVAKAGGKTVSGGVIERFVPYFIMLFTYTQTALRLVISAFKKEFSISNESKAVSVLSWKPLKGSLGHIAGISHKHILQKMDALIQITKPQIRIIFWLTWVVVMIYNLCNVIRSVVHLCYPKKLDKSIV